MFKIVTPFKLTYLYHIYFPLTNYILIYMLLLTKFNNSYLYILSSLLEYNLRPFSREMLNLVC